MRNGGNDFNNIYKSTEQIMYEESCITTPTIKKKSIV